MIDGAAMRRQLLALYERLPYRWRVRDRAFREWTARLARLDAMSTEAVRDWQLGALRDLLRRAYTQTRFYRRHWDAAGFHPDALRSLEDLAHVPPVTKDDVRKHAVDMVVAGRPPERLWKNVTSGTTGSPLTLYTDRHSSSREFAAICWQWASVGYRPGLGRVEFRGVVVGDAPFVALPTEEVLRVNVHALDERALPAVAAAIRRSGYRFFHGYPSAVERFCELLGASGLVADVPAPTAVLLSSEAVFPLQRRRIAGTFPASRIIAHYGQAERVAVGAWSDECDAYHFLPGHCVVERAADTGELLGTGFGNDSMLLVRYRLGDVPTAFESGPHAHAPTRFPVAIGIDGRLEDYLYKPDGRRVPPAVVTFPFKEGRTFSAVRLVQHALDRIEILVEATAPEPAVRQEFELVLERLRVLFGPAMGFELHLVERIPRSAAGKFRWLENRVDSTRARAAEASEASS